MKSKNRMDRDAYRDLHKAVLERDGWRCQICGARTGLEVHHIRFRSRQGSDDEQNLITVCSRCHRQVHGCREFLRRG
jgi:5-methylcytosine-specific restriction endonuclease McrA